MSDQVPLPPPSPPTGPGPTLGPGTSWNWSSWRGSGRRRGILPGLVLILVGVFFLLANLGLLDWLRWDLVWPALLIVLGIYLVSRRR
jgi:hypothetical protein